MADHIPHYFPGDTVTFTASAAITGGQLVEITGNMTVGPAGAASTKVVGVAARDAANGALVPVHRVGVHDLTATGAITAGDHVVAAAAGTVATVGANTFQTDVGIALESIANAAKGRIALTRVG